MIKPQTIDYHDAKLEVCSCLVDLWPSRLPLDKWPSFCGAGSGIGDWIIPENIAGVCCSCVCFDHDVSWAIADNTVKGAMDSNWRMYNNLRNLTLANYDQAKHSKSYVEFKCILYLFGVCIGLKRNFKPDSALGPVTDDPLQHPTVKDRLHKLAMETLDDRQFYTNNIQGAANENQ